MKLNKKIISFLTASILSINNVYALNSNNEDNNLIETRIEKIAKLKNLKLEIENELKINEKLSHKIDYIENINGIYLLHAFAEPFVRIKDGSISYEAPDGFNLYSDEQGYYAIGCFLLLRSKINFIAFSKDFNTFARDKIEYTSLIDTEENYGVCNLKLLKNLSDWGK